MTTSAVEPAPGSASARWPLHPPSAELESLSSWLDRIAVLYKLTTEQLIGPRNLTLAQPYPAYQLDVDPPPAVLAALAERTGVPVMRLQAMTLAGWVPCLTDELPPLNARRVVQVFYNYMRANPVLFPFGEAGLQDPEGQLRNWAGPWQPPKPLNRACPVCLTEPGRGRDLMWRLLLRSLLDEASLAITSRYTRPRTTLTKIWETTDLPPRGGLNVWTPYEVLEPDQQHAMMTAAATALDLAVRGEIVAEGRLGSAIQPPAPRHVYSGDRPAPRRSTAWDDLLVEAEQLLQLARTDSDVARDVLQLLTRRCRTLDRYEQQRSYLFGAGIPASFLPGAVAMGRTDLS